MSYPNSHKSDTHRPAQHRHADFDKFKKANRAELNAIESHVVDLHENSVAVARELRKIKAQQITQAVLGVATVVGLTLAHHHKK